ncbi:MAG: prephenate dehydratase [Acidobacteriota bacterium]|nr:prephenate dehydratase [Acidobacteriota bacterium]
MSAQTPAKESPVELWYGTRRKTPPQPESAAVSQPGAGPRVAIQGELGAFSHEAALKLIPDAVVVPFSHSIGVFAALAAATVDAAALPIENSLAGSVSEHFDLLLTHDVTVVAETRLRIRHNLIVIYGTRAADVVRVFSHPVALAQCKQFLAAHPNMEPFAFYDTAGSVKQLVEIGDRQAAAIASEAAARTYGAKILHANIEDNSENYTRFFLVKRAEDAVPDPAANKVSLAFSVENRPGSLVAALNALAALGTNLTKIESRPVHGKPWEYVFYVDCQIQSPSEADHAVDVLHKHCAMVKELGRYHEGLE